MKILFFDTETTGMLVKNAPLEYQPRVVQYGAIVGEYTIDKLNDVIFENEENIDLLFNPGCAIPAVVTAIHGVSDEMVADKPSFKSYAKDFVRICNEVDFIVAHNIDFDMNMMFNEIDHVWKIDSKEKREWKEQFKSKMICTMQTTIELCNIPGKFGRPKFPKLSELHVKLFGKDFDNAHNAFADIAATRDCFFELVRNGFLNIEK